jgi:hypothetical protein
MIWLYLIAAILIAGGIVKDLSRRETWLLGFGKIVRKQKPKMYWLTIGLRTFIFLAVVVAAYFRNLGS